MNKYNVPVWGNVTVEANSEAEAVTKVENALLGKDALDVVGSLEIGNDVYQLDPEIDPIAELKAQVRAAQASYDGLVCQIAGLGEDKARAKTELNRLTVELEIAQENERGVAL